MWKTKKPRSRKLALDSWDAYGRNDFSEPRNLHLPIHRKALNSLNQDIWFSLISNDLLIFYFMSFLYLLCFAFAKLLYILAPPLCLWDRSSELSERLFLLFSNEVMSNSLWPHGLQHTSLPCHSPSPRVCPSLSPLNQWCHPTISAYNLQ